MVCMYTSFCSTFANAALYHYALYDVRYHNSLCNYFMQFCCISVVSDADGDTVRCRWATLAQEECADVCQVFPATLDQVS